MYNMSVSLIFVIQFPTKPNGALLPKFAMFSNLKLGFVSVEVLLGLIQNAPALNTHFSRLGILKFNHELLNSAAVPDCLTSMLERMSFSLAYAELVESKVIEEFKEKLYSFKKGISFAILEFSYNHF
ncbi:unnamed protein product [Vicia faba]|uniref:Uncharacterized protein n=1 Tax=Vicia faba TaxID=3906 RepID=A0AAV1BD55_VICFA|nr:unnamed protein product [Vicia faba]